MIKGMKKRRTSQDDIIGKDNYGKETKDNNWRIKET